MHQKFRLFAPCDVRISQAPASSPAPRLHRIPIHAPQILEVREELGHRFRGMAIRETPTRQGRSHLLRVGDQINHVSLATLVRWNTTLMDCTQHWRAVAEVEWNVIGDDAARSDGLPL